MIGDRPPPRRVLSVVRALWPWLVVIHLGGIGALVVNSYLFAARGAEVLEWHDRKAAWLAVAGGFVGVVAFHLHRRRAAAMGFSRVGLVGARGLGAWLSDLPGVLRVLAIVAIAIALARPETVRTVEHTKESVDIMIVFDMSKSMEETDLPRDRMDAAQRVIRRFIRSSHNDRIGLVIFGQQAMLHTPLTYDMKMLEQTVADLAIGDVPELGTAIGDGLAMALAVLRRPDECNPDPTARATCPEDFTCSSKGVCEAPSKKRNKVVILLSDGDNNASMRFAPDQAAKLAATMGIPVHTVLVGREESDLFGGMSVNPETLRSMAAVTGGEFFRATDYASFDRGFQAVRKKLDLVKHKDTERLPARQLFAVFATLAAALIAIELLLSHTRLRRLP